ncbi:AraC-binding-like domain-containing protein [Xaviernesmea oryzae]|uniref:AraC-binding-like domain-containing protein n=1 Tax=Xaviernesmea oryzae TaxID=464029 RepID=A0A1X7DL27_9HYPH|nr:helix-turn-helix domain-containing protein [Xaviernesmea oryzae]SMF17622.1 AraC-binding-like domain-containing protein [Xaviernesmea oryzae]
MGVIERFSTAAVKPAGRLDFWNQLCCETLTETYVDTDVDGFRAEMWRWSIGDLAMIRPRSDASVVRRSPFASKRGERSVVLHFQHNGRSRFSHQYRQAELGVGDFVLSDAEAGYKFDLSPDHELLVVEMPRAPLEERLSSLSDKLNCRLPGTSPGGRLFREFLLSLWRQGHQGDGDLDLQKGISSVFFDMLALAVHGATTPVRNEAEHWPLRTHLLGLVELRLCEPDLRTTTLAEALGVSPRTIQNVFAAMGTTPSNYILERRLARAADLLRADRSMPVTSIAYELGFNDSAYFARCFRRRFGTSPSGWRGDN